MKQLLKKEADINSYFDFQIYLKVRDFVETTFSGDIDSDLMTKILLRKLTRNYGKFIISNNDLAKLIKYSAIIRRIDDNESYQNLISSIESLNHNRHLEICDIHLNREHQTILKLEGTSSNDDLVTHVLYKFFSKLKANRTEEFKSIIANLLTIHRAGNTIEQTISDLDEEVQPLANYILSTIGTSSIEALQNFFTTEVENDTEALIFNLDDSPEYMTFSFPSSSPSSSLAFSADSPSYLGLLGKHFPPDGNI